MLHLPDIFPAARSVSGRIIRILAACIPAVRILTACLRLQLFLKLLENASRASQKAALLQHLTARI